MSGTRPAAAGTRGRRRRAMNSGMRSVDVLALVLERRGHAADLRVDAGASRARRDHVVAQAVDQVLGLLVLRRGRRDHGDDRGVAGRVERGAGDEGDAGLAAQRARERVDRRLARPRRAARRRSRAGRWCPGRSPRCSGRRPGGSSCPAGRCRRRGSRAACRARARRARAAAPWRRSPRSTGGAGRRGSSAPRARTRRVGVRFAAPARGRGSAAGRPSGPR